MSRQDRYGGPRFEVPSERRAATAGLTQRLAERPRLFLPLYVLPQVPDKTRGSK